MGIRAVSGYQIARQSIALLLSVSLVWFAPKTVVGQVYTGQGYAPLDPVALDQLVAPIALYPDALVAQILTASTYPQQVTDAANWLRQNSGRPPEELAEIANGMPWDPSVKALTAFPNVLDNLARNYNWTAALGNAYYNQPGDVMNAIQAARFQAQRAGYLRSSPQLRVLYSGGLITIVPVNPAVVYVPYYDPWRVYGGWVSPYTGYYVLPPPRGVVLGVGLAFAAVGISIALFGHYGWGYHHWEPNWRRGVVVYDHNTYISNSTTIINRGHFGGYNRGVFEHAGPGVPANFRPPVTRATANFAPGPNAARPAPNQGLPTPNTFNRPAPGARPAPRTAAPEARHSERTGPPARSQAPRPNVAPQQNLSRGPGGPPARAEGRVSRPEPRGAQQSRPAQPRQAPQGRQAEPHGRAEGHDHR